MQRLSDSAVARFPRVRKSASVAGQDFHALAERYAALAAEPLLIRARLGTPYAPAVDGRLHLDSILSYANVTAFPFPPAWGDAPAVIPLPIECLWESPAGLPLWACSDLYPTGAAHASTEYWHKRYPQQRIQDLCAKPNAPTTRGRYKEYRIPVGVVMPENATVVALCLGHADSIRTLLDHVQFIGKKPAQGKGRVLQWEVEPLVLSVEETLATILQRRAVPHAFQPVKPGERMSLRSGWTPPYWYRPWHDLVRLADDAAD